MKRSDVLIVILFAICSTGVNAQLKLNVEIRPRAEMRDGYKQLSDTLALPAFFISQRSRLAFGFTKEKYKVYFAIQDVRVWGDELNYSSTGISGDNASIDLKEAWAEYFFSDQFSMRFGRQELKYADQRLLGGRNWNQHGMSYDALLFKYKGNFTCDVGLSYSNNKELVYQEIYSPDKMKTLNFVFLKNELTNKLTGSMIYVLSGFQNPDKAESIYFKSTPGIILEYSTVNLELSGSCYYQFGRNKEGANVSAYFWNLRTDYSFVHLSFAAGLDYISGHNYASVDSAYLKTEHLFDLLYGARHRYYGHMDYFSNLPKGTAGGGLIDTYFDATFNIMNKLSLKTAYHYFRLQNNVLDPEYPELRSVLNKSLANEVDLMLSYKPSKDLMIEIGYAFLISAESLNNIQNISGDHPKDAHWIWFTCKINPSVILSKNEGN
ncbi:hypothetical protein ES708_06110 [subsurface metagenome]